MIIMNKASHYSAYKTIHLFPKIIQIILEYIASFNTENLKVNAVDIFLYAKVRLIELAII